MPPKPTDVQVLFEDQQNINAFNRLNQRLHEVDAELTARKGQLEDQEDAENEIMLADDEQVRYAVGECFFHLSTEDAEARLALDKTTTQASQSALEEERQGIQDKMADLKKVLYGKFGNAINLEE